MLMGLNFRFVCLGFGGYFLIITSKLSRVLINIIVFALCVHLDNYHDVKGDTLELLYVYVYMV